MDFMLMYGQVCHHKPSLFVSVNVKIIQLSAVNHRKLFNIKTIKELLININQCLSVSDLKV